MDTISKPSDLFDFDKETPLFFRSVTSRSSHGLVNYLFMVIKNKLTMKLSIRSRIAPPVGEDVFSEGFMKGKDATLKDCKDHIKTIVGEITKDMGKPIKDRSLAIPGTMQNPDDTFKLMIESGLFKIGGVRRGGENDQERN